MTTAASTKTILTPDYLRDFLTRHELSQAQLAQALEVTQGLISKWLKGKSPCAGPAALLILRIDAERKA